jgi:WD40 repeat protein
MPPGHAKPVTAVAVAANGGCAISGSSDTLKVWNLDTGETIHTLEANSDAVHAVAMTPDGQRAVSGSVDKTLRVWDLRSGKVLRTLNVQSPMHALAVTANGQRAISGSLDNTIEVLDLPSGEVLHTLNGRSARLCAVAASADGQWAVSGLEDGTLVVWNLTSGNALHTFRGEAPMNAVAVTPDGRTIVAGDNFGRMHFLRLDGL